MDLFSDLEVKVPSMPPPSVIAGLVHLPSPGPCFNYPHNNYTNNNNNTNDNKPGPQHQQQSTSGSGSGGKVMTAPALSFSPNISPKPNPYPNKDKQEQWEEVGGVLAPEGGGSSSSGFSFIGTDGMGGDLSVSVSSIEVSEEYVQPQIQIQQDPYKTIMLSSSSDKDRDRRRGINGQGKAKAKAKGRDIMGDSNELKEEDNPMTVFDFLLASASDPPSHSHSPRGDAGSENSRQPPIIRDSILDLIGVAPESHSHAATRISASEKDLLIDDILSLSVSSTLPPSKPKEVASSLTPSDSQHNVQHHHEVHPDNNPIVFSATAKAAPVIKKKKKSAKVGYARENEVGDLVEESANAPAPVSASILQLSAVSSLSSISSAGPFQDIQGSTVQETFGLSSSNLSTPREAEQSYFAKGDSARFRDNQSGSISLVTVIGVHYDAGTPPYYTIKVNSSGNERSVEHEQLDQVEDGEEYVSSLEQFESKLQATTPGVCPDMKPSQQQSPSIKNVIEKDSKSKTEEIIKSGREPDTKHSEGKEKHAVPHRKLSGGIGGFLSSLLGQGDKEAAFGSSNLVESSKKQLADFKPSNSKLASLKASMPILNQDAEIEQSLGLGNKPTSGRNTPVEGGSVSGKDTANVSTTDNQLSGNVEHVVSVKLSSEVTIIEETEKSSIHPSSPISQKVPEVKAVHIPSENGGSNSRDSGSQLSKLSSFDPVPMLERRKDNLDSIIHDFQGKTTSLCFNLREIRKKQNGLLSDRVVHESEQAAFEKDLHRYEEEQQLSAQAEDFERADALNDIIDQVKQQTALRATALKEITSDLDALERQKSQCQTELMDILHDTATLLNTFNEASFQELESITSGANAKFLADKKRLSSEKERVDMEMGHIEKEEKALKDETENIERLISGQTTEVASLRDEMDEKLHQVDTEIEKLENALRTKRAERERIQASLQHAEEQIERVRCKYDRQLQRLNEKERMLYACRSDCEQENSILMEDQKKFTMAKESLVTFRGSMNSLMDGVTREINVANILTMSLQPSDLKKMSVDADASDKVKLLEKLQVHVGEAEEKLHIAQSLHDRIQSNIISLREEIESIDIKIPQLEQAKKDAAAARNYKDAAARNKEIKDFLARKELAEVEMRDSTQSFIDQSEELNICKNQYILADKALKDSMTGLELQRVNDLCENALGLKRIKKQLQSMELSQLQMSGIILLEEEISAYVTEAEDLCTRHNIDRVLLAKIGEIEENEQIITLTKDCQNIIESSSRNEKNEAELQKDAAVAALYKNSNCSNGEAPRTLTREDKQRARDLHLQIIDLDDQLRYAVENEDYDLAFETDNQIQELKRKLEEIKATYHNLDIMDCILGDDDEDSDYNIAATESGSQNIDSILNEAEHNDA